METTTSPLSYLPLPHRLFSREIHGGGRQGNGRRVFVDVMSSAMSSLEWKEGLSQCSNFDSSPYEPIPIYCLAASVGSPELLVADESGHLHILQDWFSSSSQLPVPSNSLHVTDKAALTSIKCLADKIIVGTGSGPVCVLDLNAEQLLYSFEEHYKAVKKVDSFNGDVIVSCGKDNRICMFDLRMKAHNPVNLILEAHSLSESGRSRRVNGKLQPEPSSLSTSVADFVFLDEFHILSCGSSDGRLKEWDLRLSYKQYKKCHPVQVMEYPTSSNVRGYSCLKLSGSKLFAASVNHEIFKIDVGTMFHEATFVSPAKMTNYTKLDVSPDGNFLAVGSEDPQVSIFSTITPTPKLIIESDTEDDAKKKKKFQVPFIEPFKCLNHEPVYSSSVCCPLFSPFDDLMLTTGGDTSIVTKWTPSIYLNSSKDLEKEAFKQDIENPPVVSAVQSEFKLLSRNQPLSLLYNDKENDIGGKRTKSACPRVCFAKLDSFPNYVIDGMRLPHVAQKIRIRLRPRVQTPLTWTFSPEAKQMALKVQSAKLQDTTPKRKSAVPRKRRKFSDDSTSPKILQFFPRTPTANDQLCSPVASMDIKN